ncbi:MAG TPA: hypothetical protein VKR83_20270, partial [Ktedonobacteraceae bacterium]|nr:hypothetical protein [Ktedonobacteraceae bacterium]
MSGVQVDNSPAVTARVQDISSWKEGDISTLTAKDKKRYNRRKSAVKAYLTTQDPLEQVALRYHLPARMLAKLARRSAMLHEDGAPWGFRALVPGVRVVNHLPAPADAADCVTADEDEDSAKRIAAVEVSMDYPHLPAAVPTVGNGRARGISKKSSFAQHS